MQKERNVAVDNNTSEVPMFVYESLARSLMPVMQKHFETEWGKKAFAEWKAKLKKPKEHKLK